LHAEDITPSDFEQEQALIARLLAALPDNQSEVIRLHLHGECTFTEIAEILDEPLPTVKSRYRYGIEHLRKELQKQNIL
jgi:RNA polymerase sigma-70 factor (ECF subfamily)